LPYLRRIILPEMLPEPISYVNDAQLRRSARARAESQPQVGLMGLAIENQWATHGASRWAARESIVSEVTNVSPPVTEDDFLPYAEKFGIDDMGILRKSKTKDELQYRAQWIVEDIERHRAIQQFGIKGVGAELLAGIADPAGWLLGILSGGTGLVYKGRRLAHAARVGLMASSENMMLEAVLAQGDTQRGLRDVLISGGAGMILGSGIGSVARRKAAQVGDVLRVVDEVEIANAHVIQAADEFDTGIRAGMSRTTEDGYDFTPIRTLDQEKVVLDNPRIEDDIRIHADELYEGGRSAFSKHLNTKQRARLTTRITKATDEIKELSEMLVAHRARVMQGFGAPRTAEEITRNANRLDMIDQMYRPKIDARSSQLEADKIKLQEIKAAPRKAREFREFSDMSRVEKIHKLYPGGAPKTKVTLRSYAEDIDAVVTPKKESVPLRDKEVPEGAEAPTAEELVVDDIKRHAEEGEYIHTTGERTETMAKRLIEGIIHTAPIAKRVLPRAAADRLQGLFTTLDNSENTLIRALNAKFFENAQGGIAPELTADALSGSYLKQIRGKVRNRYNEGFDLWSVEQGRGMVRAYLDTGNWRREFDALVFRKLQDPDLKTPPSVTHAADGYRDGYSEALRIRKEMGEGGFEEVKDTRKYSPVIFSSEKLNAYLHKVGEKTGQVRVTRLLQKGYMEGKMELKADTAEKLAKMQYLRMREAGATTSSAYHTIVSEGDRARFLADLEEAGVHKDVLAEFLIEKEAKDILDNVSSRAKTSMHINVESSMDGVSVHELLNTNISELSEHYFREAAGGAAMARHGFKTYAQAMNMVNTTRAIAGRRGLHADRARDEALMLKQGIDMIYGKSIEENPRGKIEIGTRRAREFTTLMRLGQLGFAQFPEAARAISKLGLVTVLKSVPGTAVFRRRAARIGGKSSGALLEPELRELEEAFGYIGEDSYLSAINVRHDDFGEGQAFGGLRRVLDNALAAGSKLNGIMSGFQAIQGGMEKIVARGIKRRFVEMAEGTRSFKSMDMVEAGWDDAFVKEFTAWMKANPAHAEFNGKTIRLMNLKNMPPDMSERLGVGMQRLSARMVQRQYVGDTSAWMNQWLGKTLTQFRSFSIVSMEKQLLHDVRGDKVQGAQTLLWSVFLGYTAYGTQTYLNAIGKEDPDAYIDDKMSMENASWGVFNKMPQTASISLGGDFFATLGMMPEGMTASGNRYGFRTMAAGGAVPALGAAGDAVDSFNEVMNLLKGDGYSAQDADRARKLIPLMNTIGVGQLTQILTNRLGD
jgi:hypothetical protein